MTAGDPQSPSPDDNHARLDDILRASLIDAHTIAVVGIKDDVDEDAYRIPKYMQDKGYLIVPVNPKLAEALDARAFGSLTDVGAAGIPIDLVNIFRASEHLGPHVDEILAMNPLPKTVWMQLGIHHGASAKRLREAGIEVIQDRCIMVDHRRLCDNPSVAETTGAGE